MSDRNGRETQHVDAACDPWTGFKPGLWTKEINVRDFIQQNVTPYYGDGASSPARRQRTKALLAKLQAMFVEERKKGVLDVSQIPSSITAHDAGYIDKDNEIIVGLQTEAPLKRAIMPNGGFRLVANALKTYGYEPDPAVVETFTKYRKTHNDAVFDAYTADVRRCRSSHILTGLPDAYGRGRIIGDYRRVALYGVDRLIEGKKEEKDALDGRMVHRRDHPRPRGTGRADPRARRTQGDGGQVRLRHLRARAHGAGSGAVALFRLPGRRQGAERRGHVAGPHLHLPRHLFRARPRRPVCSPRSRRRRSSTTSSSSCASCVSCGRRNMTSCSPAIRPG